MKVSIRADLKLEPKLKKVITHTIKTAMKLNGRDGEVSVLVTDDVAVQALNSEYRSIDRPTDVLSFPSGEEDFLGDIAISLDRAKEQAGEYGHSLERETAFLCAHAVLHLCGFDHEDEEAEIKMRIEQRKILKEAGYEI